MDVMSAVQKVKNISFIDVLKTSLTTDVINFIEIKTKNQSKCALWADQRLGRITSSNVHKVMHSTHHTLSNIVCERSCSMCLQ